MNVEYRRSKEGALSIFKNRLTGKQGMTEEKEDKTYDLENRLIDFAIHIFRMAASLLKTKVAIPDNWILGSSQADCLLF